jgi:hypothetical protein
MIEDVESHEVPDLVKRQRTRSEQLVEIPVIPVRDRHGQRASRIEEATKMVYDTRNLSGIAWLFIPADVLDRRNTDDSVERVGGEGFCILVDDAGPHFVLVYDEMLAWNEFPHDIADLKHPFSGGLFEKPLGDRYLNDSFRAPRFGATVQEESIAMAVKLEGLAKVRTELRLHPNVGAAADLTDLTW